MSQDKFAKLREKSADFHQLFTSKDGQKVLGHLRKEFGDVPLADTDNPNKTFFNLGSRDLLVYIESMIEAHEKLNNPESGEQS